MEFKMKWIKRILQWLGPSSPTHPLHEHKFVVLSPAFDIESSKYWNRWGIEYSECECGESRSKLLLADGQEVEDLPPVDEFENGLVPDYERDYTYDPSWKPLPGIVLPNGEIAYERNTNVAVSNRHAGTRKKTARQNRRVKRTKARR